MENPIKKIDFTTLRGQKAVLIKLADAIRDTPPQPYKKDGVEMTIIMMPKETEDVLDGIINLIDSIQDYAVDELGVPEMHVFDFELEEDRESKEPMRTANPRDFEQQPGETDEEFFARNNAQTIFWMHIEGTFLYENVDMPEEFIKSIVDDEQHATAIKDRIRRDILKDVMTNPGNFDRDPDGKLTYDYTMYDYGFAIEEYCCELFNKDKVKTLWLCPNCGSDNVEMKVWANANTNEVSDNDAGEEGDGYCNDCEGHGELILSTLKESAKIVGFQVVDDSEGDIHPDMEGSFCLYNLSQAREMIKNSDDPTDCWKLLAIWTGDVEEPTIMFEGDPRD